MADEVRTLANRTQQSTDEINKMIGMVQQGSNNAVDVMTRSQDKVRDTVERSSKAREALDAITRAVTSINDMNQQIACAAEEQSSMTEEINKNVVSIRDISNLSIESSEKNQVASERLASLAEELVNKVNQFKIS